MADKKLQIAFEILAYLIENQDAQDTLEGIIEWWLLDWVIRSQTVKVKEALNELVARGWVLEHVGKDSRIRYSVNPKKLEEISSFLNQWHEGNSDHTKA
jgi:hypothetical protein